MNKRWLQRSGSATGSTIGWTGYARLCRTFISLSVIILYWQEGRKAKHGRAYPRAVVSSFLDLSYTFSALARHYRATPPTTLPTALTCAYLPPSACTRLTRRGSSGRRTARLLRTAVCARSPLSDLPDLHSTCWLNTSIRLNTIFGMLSVQRYLPVLCQHYTTTSHLLLLTEGVVALSNSYNRHHAVSCVAERPARGRTRGTVARPVLPLCHSVHVVLADMPCLLHQHIAALTLARYNVLSAAVGSFFMDMTAAVLFGIVSLSCITAPRGADTAG